MTVSFRIFVDVSFKEVRVEFEGISVCGMGQWVSNHLLFHLWFLLFFRNWLGILDLINFTIFFIIVIVGFLFLRWLYVTLCTYLFWLRFSRGCWSVWLLLEVVEVGSLRKLLIVVVVEVNVDLLTLGLLVLDSFPSTEVLLWFDHSGLRVVIFRKGKVGTLRVLGKARLLVLFPLRWRISLRRIGVPWSILGLALLLALLLIQFRERILLQNWLLYLVHLLRLGTLVVGLTSCFVLGWILDLSVKSQLNCLRLLSFWWHILLNK
jgi:hypothetical protein